MVGAPPIEHTSGGLAISDGSGTDTRSVLEDTAYDALVEHASRSLGQALAFLVNALDPGAVIVGGGLGLNPDYLARVGAAMRASLVTEPSVKVPLLPAELGEAAGVVGAALAAGRKI